MNKIFLTTNICGGLGNQLFLLANLHATALRLRQQNEQPNSNNKNGNDSSIPQLDVVAHVEKSLLSSSCHEPRPTYWHTPLMRSVNDVVLDSKDVVASPEFRTAVPIEAVQVPERGVDAQPFTLDLLQASATPSQTPPSSSPSSSRASKNNNNSNNFSFLGFFQSDRYFSDFSSQIVDILRPPQLAEMAKLDLMQRLDESGSGQRQQQEQQERQHTVAIHVRRGDYLLLKETFEILPHDYYCKALETLFGSMLFRRSGNSKKKPIKVLVFSEDKFFSRVLCGALSVKYSAVDATVALDSSAEGKSQSQQLLPPDWRQLPQEVKEMMLMSVCDDVIVANSSFSWWAGYFAHVTAPTGYCRVVAPQRWFAGKEFPDDTAHIYPKDWIVV